MKHRKHIYSQMKPVTVAIPTYRSRVSPVFDPCLRVSIFHTEYHRPVHKRELDLGTLTPLERVDMLRKQRVTTLICGGISDVLGKMLQGLSIFVIAGIAGQVEQVLEAFISGRIDEPGYRMPGFTEEISTFNGLSHSF
jgi:predicted Fe-Mo cluster-binding NifX family protein